MLGRTVTLLAVGFLVVAPAPASPQAGPGGIDAYYRAVAEHFRVDAGEVRILAEWPLPAGEIPAVLYVARRGGISPDAVVALRRSGRPWAELAARYGVHAGLLHMALPEDIELGPLERVYEEYRSRPSSSWPSIRLDDAEFVTLINLRFLAESLDQPAARVLDALVRAGTAPEAYRALVRGG